MNKRNPLPSILVVDDEPLILEVFEMIFEKNFKVLTADNGRDALDKVSKERLNLVFLDINLRETDGLRILSGIKEFRKELPVVIVTGIDDKNILAEAKRLGACNYISKPFDVKEILALAHDTIENNQTPQY